MPRPTTPVRAGRAFALSLALACGLLPGTVLAASDGFTVPQELADGTPARLLAQLPPEVAAQWAGAAMVEVGGGCSGVLIAPVAAADADPDAPAYVLTNGHCIEMLAPTAVLRDQPGSGTVAFGWPGGALHEAADVAAIPWASMKGTDLAILELDRTLADLVDAGVPAYPLARVAAPAGTSVVIVGAPARDDGLDRQLTAATCTLGPPVDLLEDGWSWTGFPADGCAGIRHGSSGSPVLAVESGELVGLVNTGTEGSEGRSDCMFDRPCEVHPDRVVSVENAVYGPSVAGLGACFDAGGRFTGPGGACPLDPGIGLRVEDATEVTNPDATRPDGRPSPTTWNAHLVAEDPAFAWYRVKTGPLGQVDCHDPAGYGAPIALATAPVIDTPLPDIEGHHQLCLLAGPGPVVDAAWQEPRFATVVTAWIDKTPPIPATNATITATAEGWTVEPVVVPPELRTFTYRVGPAATTDCADPADSRIWRHSPIRVRAGDTAQRLCLTGFDPAGNASPPFERVLDPAALPTPLVTPGPIADHAGRWSAPRDPSGTWLVRVEAPTIGA